MTDRDQSTGPEVLSSLPSRRPQRRSSRRDKGPAGKSPKAASTASAGRPRATRKASQPTAAGAKRTPAGARPAAAGARRTPAGVRPSAATRAAASAPDGRPPRAPEGLELVGTAIQAAGELAQLGLTLGTKALRGAVARIPRP